MKLLFDFLPVVLFFVAYKVWGIYAATAVAMAAAGAQIAIVWLRQRRLETIHILTFALIAVLGGATLLLQDNRFIMWKPTLVNWLLAGVFLGSHFVGDRPLIRRMMEAQITLPDPVWTRLSLSWITFFTALGFANIYVAFYYAPDLPAAEREAIWVNFKLFVMLGLTIAFVIGQAFYLGRHVKTDDQTEK